MGEGIGNNNPSNVRNKICSRCDTVFSCYMENCWCSKLPNIMPMSENEDCYCPECLKKMITEKELL
jgi:hypothetical protein